MLLHRDDDRGQAGHGLELVEVFHRAVGVEDHAVNGTLRQAARDVAQAHRPSLIELDERHRIAAIARSGNDAVESRHVAGAGDVEHAQAYAAVLPAAQGPAGEAWVEPELIHGVLDALTRLLDDARLTVHHARDRLARDARQARDIRHRHRAGSALARRRARLSCSVESRHVAGAGDVEHAQAYAAVLPAAQGPAGEAWVEPELIHGVLDALARLLDDARMAVHHARDRLARDARQARDVRHRHRAGSALARRRARLSCYRPPHSGTPSTCSRCTAPTLPSSSSSGQRRSRAISRRPQAASRHLGRSRVPYVNVLIVDMGTCSLRDRIRATDPSCGRRPPQTPVFSWLLASAEQPAM